MRNALSSESVPHFMLTEAFARLQAQLTAFELSKEKHVTVFSSVRRIFMFRTGDVSI